MGSALRSEPETVQVKWAEARSVGEKVAAIVGTDMRRVSPDAMCEMHQSMHLPQRLDTTACTHGGIMVRWKDASETPPNKRCQYSQLYITGNSIYPAPSSMWHMLDIVHVQL